MGSGQRGRTPREEKDLAVTVPAESHQRHSSTRPPPVGPSAPISTLTIGEVIAEGGMGTVRAAVQRSLGRAVVIKTALLGDGASNSMLLEAWVTGYLEHPGIVPVRSE